METTKAMLINVSVGKPDFRKYDKTATQVVAEKYDVKMDVGRYNKSLIDRAPLKPIEQAAGRIRGYFYNNTYPYMDEGPRLLATMDFPKFSEKLRELINEYNTLVESFIKKYPEYYAEAQKTHKGLFNAAELPDPNNPTALRNKFYVSVSILPIPEKGKDLRLELQEEEKEEIKKIMEENFKKSEENFTRALWEDLYKAISHMVERLSDPDKEFKNSLVGNIMKLCETLPKLNLTKNPELDDMVREVESKLRVSPDTLRANKKFRASIAKQADDLLKNISGYVES